MWRQGHPEEELTAYLTGELTEELGRRTAEHLERCRECAAWLQSSRELIDLLKEGADQPPALDWQLYRSELRQKIAERQQSREVVRSWWFRPLVASGLAAAALAGLIVLMVSRGPASSPDQVRLTPWQKATIGSHLDLLENYQIVEQLDLLENLDVIQELDESTTPPGGADAQSSLGRDHDQRDRHFTA